MDNDEKFLNLLNKNKNWPVLYPFKFVVLNQEEKIKEIVALLPNYGAFSYRESSNGKYVSITCKAHMNTAQEIIDITRSVSKLSGVISL